MTRNAFFRELVQRMPGVRQVQVTHGGLIRDVWVYIPEGHTGSLPFIVALHGTGAIGPVALHMAQLTLLADAEGIVLIAPDAWDGAFTDGTSRAGQRAGGVDDTAFIDALPGLIAPHCPRGVSIDPGRAYLTGISSGASMAQRVMAQGEGVYAAAVCFGDGLYVPQLRPPQPGALLLLWGGQDPVSPEAGCLYSYPTGPLYERPHAEILADWGRRYGGQMAQPLLSTPPDDLTLTAWPCAPGYALASVRVAGLGHHWLGGPRTPLPEAIVGPYPSGGSFTSLMWAFMAAHPIRAPHFLDGPSVA